MALSMAHLLYNAETLALPPLFLPHGAKLNQYVYYYVRPDCNLFRDCNTGWTGRACLPTPVFSKIDFAIRMHSTRKLWEGKGDILFNRFPFLDTHFLSLPTKKLFSEF